MKKKMMWLPAILLMIVIFYFSNQPAEISADLSGGISYQVVSLAVSITGQNWSNEEIFLLAEKMDYPIRKLAHLTEYTLLGMTIALGVIYGSHWNKYNRKRQYFLVQVIGSLYAVSDEIHQLFVFGRAGRISDVLIDSVGVLVGWCLFVGGIHLFLKRK